MKTGLFDELTGIAVTFIIVKLIIYPAILVWAVNTLFDAGISYTNPQNWLAAVALLVVAKAI